MVISVASGKGGTGKTTVACGLTSVIDQSVYIDCDVEEPDGHILLKPEIYKEEECYKLVPSIGYENCNFCGKCIEVCEFNALVSLKTEIIFYEELCHSCGSCVYFCPGKAITETEKKNGKIRSGEISSGKLFFDGCLNIGETAAAPLIRKVKNTYKGKRPVIIDSPPGTSCSMMEAVKDSDYCVLVTESTPFGLNDLKLAVAVLDHLRIPYGIVINKYDKEYSRLEEYLRFNMHDILLKIPFSMEIAGSYSKGELISGVIKEFRLMMIDLYNNIQIRAEKDYAGAS